MGHDLDDILARYDLPEEARAALRELLDDRQATVVQGPADLGFADDDAPEVGADRYEDLGPLGRGGMAEVREVRDRRLHRALAMKIIHPRFQRAPGVLGRFLAEAQVTAQLEHPGIVPIHDLGRTEDGRVWFTMKKVRGETLTAVLDAVHAASDDEWGTAAGGWTLHRVVDAFRRVCEAVSHAHDRGVLHRDLKPDNVMVGPWGEVLVLDWGLARTLGEVGGDGLGDVEPVVSDRAHTRVGTIAGTPGYMAPEQARGEVDQLTPAADVYALGAMLFEILYGRPPHAEVAPEGLLAHAASHTPKLPALPRPIPDELDALWRHAMALAPGDRPAHAGVVAERVRRWQEGAERRERARAIVAQAEVALPRVGQLRARAAAYAEEAQRASRELEPWEAVERKRGMWELEDEAGRLRSEAEREEVRVTELLRAALTQFPELPEARARLADLYQERHAEAERGRDHAAAFRYEQLLRAHDDGRHAAWLEGAGSLTLRTEPPGATADLCRMVDEGRRLVPQFERSLGATPIVDLPLPRGSWLVVLRSPGRAEVRYPVHVGRLERWDGVGPDGEPVPVSLPEARTLGPDDVVVPGGWCVLGGDPEAPTGAPWQRAWVESFVIRRYPVTNRAYLAFLDALVAEGREEEALRCAPRERGTGQLVYARAADGRFAIAADADGDRWSLDWPVFLVDHDAARAFAAWEARRTGRPWRLPTEAEWEKAARGVDGRFFPWGDRFDPTFARCRTSRPGLPLPADVTEHPDDASPYGVRGMAGNVAEWCADAPLGDPGLAATREPAPAREARLGPHRDADVAIPHVHRGGAWSYDERAMRLGHRRTAVGSYRAETIGFRLARSLQ